MKDLDLIEVRKTLINLDPDFLQSHTLTEDDLANLRRDYNLLLEAINDEIEEQFP